jgi:hypothetical protein
MDVRHVYILSCIAVRAGLDAETSRQWCSGGGATWNAALCRVVREKNSEPYDEASQALEKNF